MGCVIYEMVALKPPFRAESMELLFKKVQLGKFPRIAGTYSIDLANLIRSCLQV
jgi:NIMA (never in mitosis gene a)-related kinase